MSRRLAIVFLLGLSAGLIGGPLAHASSLPQMPSPVSSDTGSTARPVVQRLLVKGIVETQLGDYEEAIVYLEKALEKAPKASPLLQALADAHAAQGDLPTALFYARKARRYAPDRVYYHRRLAELQREAGQPQDAVSTYQALLQRFPEARTAYRNLAELQTALDRPQAALSTYETLLHRGVRSPASLYRKMLPLYRRTGNDKGLEQALRTLVEQRPNNSRYKRLLGEHYADTGRPNAAFDLLSPLAEQYPEDPDLQRRAEQLAQQTGRTLGERPSLPSDDATSAPAPSAEQLVRQARTTLNQSTSPPDPSALRTAEKLLHRALERAPQHVPALRLRARLHHEQDEFVQAGRLLKRAVEETPKAQDLWRRAARMYLKGHEYDAAASVAEEGLLLFPGDVALLRTAAFARLRADVPQQAQDHFEDALTFQQNGSAPTAETAVLRAGLALALTVLDRPKEADAALEKALAAAPDNPTVLHTCAYSLSLRKEQLDRALELSRRAVNRTPSLPLPLDTLGWVHFQRGNLEAAHRILQRALNAGPPSRRILEHFGDVQKAMGNDAAARRYWQKALDRAPNRPSLRKKLESDSAS